MIQMQPLLVTVLYLLSCMSAGVHGNLGPMDEPIDYLNTTCMYTHHAFLQGTQYSHISAVSFRQIALSLTFKHISFDCSDCNLQCTRSNKQLSSRLKQHLKLTHFRYAIKLFLILGIQPSLHGSVAMFFLGLSYCTMDGPFQWDNYNLYRLV